MSIPVIRSSMPPMEEYMAEIAPLWESRYLSNHGEKARELERRAAEYLGSDHAVSAVTAHSGHDNSYGIFSGTLCNTVEKIIHRRLMSRNPFALLNLNIIAPCVLVKAHLEISRS